MGITLWIIEGAKVKGMWKKNRPKAPLDLWIMGITLWIIGYVGKNHVDIVNVMLTTERKPVRQTGLLFGFQHFALTKLFNFLGLSSNVYAQNFSFSTNFSLVADS